jgi:hypothetical protein
MNATKSVIREEGNNEEAVEGNLEDWYYTKEG